MKIDLTLKTEIVTTSGVFTFEYLKKRDDFKHLLMELKNNSIVGFSPCFYTLGETLPQIIIAKKFAEQDGQVIFFSHGGLYEKFVKSEGFKVIKLKEMKYIETFKNITNREKLSIEKRHMIVYNPETLGQLVESQISAYNESN